MDSIILAFKNITDHRKVELLLSEAGIVTTTRQSDNEIEEGLGQFCSANMISQTLFLGLGQSDENSNRLTEELYSQLAEKRPTRIAKLARSIETDSSFDDAWFLFAYEWNADDEISYFCGSASLLSYYLKIHGGPYRRPYSLQGDCYNLDLDTPMVWKISSAPND